MHNSITVLFPRNSIDDAKRVTIQLDYNCGQTDGIPVNYEQGDE